jgi:hypothetical protein
MSERKRMLRFGVSSSLVVSAVAVMAPGCFLTDSTVTSNPAPACPEEPVACGEEEPGCSCYTINPAPFDMEVDLSPDADMDAADLDEDMDPDMADMLDMGPQVVDN